MARLKNLAMLAYGSLKELEIVGCELNHDNRPKIPCLDRNLFRVFRQISGLSSVLNCISNRVNG
jgi:hypothetical protein